jgi:hypothetical protein
VYSFATCWWWLPFHSSTLSGLFRLAGYNSTFPYYPIFLFTANIARFCIDKKEYFGQVEIGLRSPQIVVKCHNLSSLNDKDHVESRELSAKSVLLLIFALYQENELKDTLWFLNWTKDVDMRQNAGFHSAALLLRNKERS